MDSAERADYRISIHAPRTGSDAVSDDSDGHAHPISIHAPRTGSDAIFSAVAFSSSPFQSTLPARGATKCATPAPPVCIYFNPRSPHGERRAFRARLRLQPCNFNPRSPHGERHQWTVSNFRCLDFNPRSPHGERPLGGVQYSRENVFQSTLPARGATVIFAGTWRLRKYHFNPRSPHGERHCARNGEGVPNDFNPRSPHGERHRRAWRRRVQANFNPRSPHGERRAIRRHDYEQKQISIHAPRTGSDALVLRRLRLADQFQSTLPARGATCMKAQRGGAAWSFQSTLPARGATQLLRVAACINLISIHAPRTGSDRALRLRAHPAGHFNPRSPHGERRFAWMQKPPRCLHFNPRSPHGERHK